MAYSVYFHRVRIGEEKYRQCDVQVLGMWDLLSQQRSGWVARAELCGQEVEQSGSAICRPHILKSDALSAGIKSAVQYLKARIFAL